MKEIVIDSLSDLNIVAKALLSSLNGRSVVALFAPMGAGKTTLISALMEHLGSADTVTSPTFALVNQYSTVDKQIVYHHRASSTLRQRLHHSSLSLTASYRRMSSTDQCLTTTGGLHRQQQSG